MSASSTRYTPHFELPELLERGRDETITCPVYRAGALVAPSAGTVSVFDPTGTAVVDGADIDSPIEDSAASYTIPTATLEAHDYGEGWRVEWSLTMPDGVVHRFKNDAAIVRDRLYPVIADVDIIRRCRALDPSSATAITAQADYQDAIDEADIELQLRLIERGERPWAVATPSGLRQVWLALAIAIIFEDLASRNDAYTSAAAEWRQRYESAFAKATVRYDRNQDGVADTDDRESVRAPVVWLC